MKTALLSILLVFGLLAKTPVAVAASADPSILHFLQTSAYDWNHGDLGAFMTGYENSPKTEYIGSKNVILGFAAIRAHYASHYGRGAMGTLSFSNLAIRPLGTEYAVVVARWHLALANGTKPSGIFSLVLHRSTYGWRIIVDHTP